MVALVAFLAFAAADGLEDYCTDVATRSGCAGCEASVDCVWCSDPKNTIDAGCYPGTSCEARLDGKILGAVAGRSCPADPHDFQAPIRKSDFDPDESADAKNAFRYNTFHDEHFCGLGLDFPVDRFAFSIWHTDDVEQYDSVCGYTNAFFGFPGLQIAKKRCKKRVSLEQFENGYNDGYHIDSKERLLEVIDFACDGPNPYTYEGGIECIRLMKEAYCSVGCGPYHSAAGRPCIDSNDFLEIKRLCAPFTDNCGHCPLNPDRLVEIFGDGDPIACDSELRTVEETQYFQEVFGLHDELDEEEIP
eukprot:TRINITY_DN7238_c0_g1_i1.p1 TRINITY_DN7238_c0_g1~~TRINITY_DN7238_c0_g1_i1.p1  ORF type:complete len:318 (+),score=80.73 TRINITY_DN7238_c0_g1_i1:43-954(+)